MFSLLRKLHREDCGQDLIEYALVGLLIALGAVAGMGTLANSITGEYENIAAQLT
jgi:Flp pilus assembly pilin Flp